MLYRLNELLDSWAFPPLANTVAWPFLAALSLTAVNCLVQAPPAGAIEPWSPNPISNFAPAIKGTAITTDGPAQNSGHAPSYQDPAVENALDIGDYARGQALINQKLTNCKGGSFNEAYLRTTLVESLIWQGQMNPAATELKKLKRILDGLKGDGADGRSSDDVKELRARALDDESWLQESLGDMRAAAATADSAAVLLKELRTVDKQTWRLVDCLSHSAALKAASGDYQGARKLLEESLVQAGGSRSISPLNVADVEESLGSVFYRLGDQKQAFEHFGQALRIKNGTGALTRRYAPGPYWLSPDYRHIEGSPWSSKSYQNGLERKKIDPGPVSVEATVVRDKNAGKQVVQVMLSVVNKSGQSIEFMGKRPSFMVLSPKASMATMIEPTALAAQIQKKGDGKAKWVRFWGQGATQTMTSNYIGNMPFYGNGYGGAYPPVMGFGGMGYGGMGYGGGYWNRSGNMTTMVTNIPDPIAEARAFQKAQQIEDSARTKASDIRSTSLGPTDIAAGQSLNGSIYFDASGLAKGSSCLVTIPIGDADFEFHFDNIADGQ